MVGANLQIKIRPMTLEDLDPILSNDPKIRAMGKAITYAHLTTERIFTIDRRGGRMTRPVSYADFITRETGGLLEFGLVAEIDGHVHGFILGRVAHLGERPPKWATFSLLGCIQDSGAKGLPGSWSINWAKNFAPGGSKKCASESINGTKN